MNQRQGSIFIYGPPGSGKTTIGQILAAQLGLPFADLDQEIEKRSGQSVAELFAVSEEHFREWEKSILTELLAQNSGVVALGGGSLLDPESRQGVEQSGRVICLDAPVGELSTRLRASENQRPLLAGDLASRLPGLIAQRESHYRSFSIQVATTNRSPDEAAWEIQVRLGRFWISGMGTGYEAVIQPGSLVQIGRLLEEGGFEGPVVLVSDRNMAGLYVHPVWETVARAGYAGGIVVLPAGEDSKTLESTAELWKRFLELGLERRSTVLSLGGGVVSDLAGFAAATYLRGIRWAAVPTTLLAMVDASLGGKTGVDLVEGKNLVGAFHAPGFVCVDPDVLQSLPIEELRSGMAEVVKHGVIGDPELFSICTGFDPGMKAGGDEWERLVARAVAVKVKTILADPFEQGVRAALNLGHTIGHGIELASQFSIRHGEAVAIGMVLEARLAEQIGLGEAGIAARIAEVLSRLGLPVQLPPDIPSGQILEAMAHDKKKKGGELRFALPSRIGEVKIGVGIELPLIEAVLNQKP